MDEQRNKDKFNEHKTGEQATGENRIDEQQIEETIKKFDRSERTRKLTGILARITALIAVSMSLYHLYTAFRGTPAAIIHRSIHVTFMLVLIFILYPSSSRGIRSVSILDYILILLSLVPPVYLNVNFQDIVMRAGMPTTTDVAVGCLLIVLVLEATRRVTGWVLPILSMVFMLYGFFGNILSGYFSHRGFSFSEVMEYLYLTTEGIFGVPIGVSAQYLVLFIIFGAFLLKSGVGDFITDLAIALAGSKRGGPAQVAVLSSALMGSINGSAVANVVTTGTFTIPLMKRIGYSPEFAGAVEATASCGGQILPPVMGAAAFMMAEILGIRYVSVMYAAIIPALLYYLGVAVAVYLRALKRDLKGLDKSEVPRIWDVLRGRFYLFAPLVVLVYLLVKGYTPTYAAFFAILLTIPVSWLNPKTRMTPKKILEALEAGAKSSVSVAIACAVVGIVVGISTMSGFGIKMAGGIINIAGGNLFFTLVLTMLACIILGMGMPSIPAYILTVNMAAPALLQLGIQPLVSHFFVFYFAMLANVTPPVALAAFAASGISGGDMNKTGIEAFKLALAGFIVPYMFVYNPVLLGQGGSAVPILSVAVTAFLGVVALAAAAEGFLVAQANVLERMLLLVAGLSLIKPGSLTDLIGLAVTAGVVLLQMRRRQNSVSA